ncbi:serine/threonine-protein kinase [Dactylosporangium sp. NPDC049525]|uniref:serine/threonine-protein kinase n=1 Tax=Dactylosporangium sp. NPDC049525 TaxID=3154730 RepID=UPI00341E943F
MSPLASGVRLHDRFTLRDRIGVGGMSQVWRAEDEVLGRQVAVKVLTTPLAADPLLRAATWTEARAAARLAHPHVTQVYDYGEAALPSGAVVAYLVMELVEGQSLADRLRFGPLPWQQATIMAAQVAAALAAAHRIGVVHRDIKPGNVMLTHMGAKILDFGIAALSGGEPDGDGGRLVGTPTYAAPERLRPGAALPESDVYALGVLLYEALTGHPPVRIATWQEAAAAHRTGPPVPPPQVPGLPHEVRRLCMDCMSPDPAQRPSAEAVAQDLAAAAGQPPQVTTALPILVADPPPATHTARAGYAVGSAPLPHPPTMIESRSAVLAEEPDVPAARRMSRPLLGGLIGTVVVLVLALTVVTTMLLSRPADRTAQPGAPTQTSPPPSLSPSAAASPAPSATTPQAIVNRLDVVIADALADGRIDSDAADKLRDKLRDLRQNIGRSKERRAAQDLQRRINDMRDDRDLDEQTADTLTALLRPLLD